MEKREMTENEKKVLKTCEAEAKKAKLPMDMLDARYITDERKIVFRFYAENRVDFRDLVKELKTQLHIKVELHQIGPRDRAMEVGGLPPCGQEELCCKRLGGYTRVTEEMLEAQGLKPSQKMYGYCGRQKCCYAHEYFADGSTTENRESPCSTCAVADTCNSRKGRIAKPTEKRFAYLIRHPKTVVEDPKVYIDGKADVELSDDGKTQAKQVAKKLKDAKIEKVFTSPMKRAKAAAEIIGKDLNVSVTEMENLREINVGIWSGLEEKDIIKNHPRLWDAWIKKPEITKIPEGEPLSAVQRRVQREIKACIDTSRGNIVIVMHKIAMITYLMAIKGISMKKIWKVDEKLGLKKADIIRIDLETSKFVKLKK